MDPYFGIFGTVFKNGFGNTRRLQSVPFYLFFFSFFSFLSFVSFSPSPKGDGDDDSPHGMFPRLLSSAPSEDRSKPPRTTRVSVLTASLSSSPSEDRSKPTVDDDSVGPYGVSSGLESLSGVW